ncbi:MAG: ABC transporter ATP-binding protein/permease [Treponema sp.]|jgi:ATP-binding cassette subfamily B protein|nr:ABC transporter ATP-binding protein/permease [Treponema sp.]
MSETAKDEKAGLAAFKTLKPYFFRYRLPYILGFVCLLVVDGAQAILPQFIRAAVDTVSGGNFLWTRVLRICLAMLGVMAAIALGRFLWRYFIHGSSRRIETELRDDLFRRLLSLSYDFYQKNKIGDLMARSISDLNAVRNALGWGIVTLVDGTIMAASILVIIIIQDPQTALYCIAPLPLITVVMLFFGKAMGRRFRRAHETYSAMSDAVQETFAGIRVVKSFVKEWWFVKKFERTNDAYRDANMSLVKLYGFFFPFVSFLAGLTTVILLLTGGRRVVLGYLSAGELVALFSYLQMLIWPLMGAGFMVNMIQRGAAGMARINEALFAEPSIRSPALPRRGGNDTPAIELRSLTFAYPPIGENKQGVPVLDGISLVVERGTALGILGRTGSGKSTLVKALVRMIDPPAGQVFIKGVDVRDYDLGELRLIFAVCPQDAYLFSDTIKNNIAYGKKDSDAEPAPAELSHAALLSALDRDLESFARGWETLIGERGLTLSGGQKQRVAIARALLSAGEILILDDAFSAVDAETEKRVLGNILKERAGKTTIIISHRVSTLSGADKVLVLEKGKVSEYGSPRELLAAGNFFARTAELQRLGDASVSSGGEAARV